ncbi:Hpt domain-containing protein [Azoarcus sp. KH32C]|uniref:hybrid sensor histidine kinase/response regulator n=1 Tax=Azoarcus sp. KH32C TaxID=748247 RepID=UPI0002387066|nr:Hpt domain-containing protein [Azoarcus sp. KH32C]BAL26122.1 pili chemotaxis protein similar [Azoarcus sp. KH32C]
MTHPNELDLGPLTWVKNEIDLALARADESLELASGAPDAPARIQFAQTHLHQVRGAISIVGLDGLAQFATSLDLSLAAVARGERPADEATLKLARRALATMGNYLEELVHGTPDQPLRLLPLYREIHAIRSADPVSPAELFFPDLSQRPPRREIASSDLPEEARQNQLRTLRAQFQRGLLQWLRAAGDAAGPTAMLNAVQGMEALHTGTPIINFWYAAEGFLEALANGDLPAQPEIKKLGSQLDAQLKRLADTPGAVPERLIRELLYWTAQAPARSAQQKAARTTWHLDALIPEAGASVSATPLAALLKTLQGAMVASKEAWDEFSEGHAAALPHFETRLADLIAEARQLGRPALDRLLAALGDFVGWVRKDPLRINDQIALEVATALLLADSALQRGAPDAGFSTQAADTANRLDALMRGEQVAAAEYSATVETARRQQEREALGQVSREILSSLAQVEQILDDYFRNQAKRAPLAGLAKPLKQIEGALTLVGDAEAIALVHDAAATIARFAETDAAPQPGQFERLAQRLSALGFYVEALQRGPATLQRFLAPLAPQPAVTAEEAPPITIETARPATPSAPPAPVALEPAPAPEAITPIQVTPEPEAPVVAPLASAVPTLEAAQEEPLEAVPLLEPVPAPAPTPTPPEPAKVADTGAADVDAELLAIFIEEAHEVLATVGEELALLRTAPDSIEHLRSIRRGFHTLKGSGRMVGLRDLGESAWGLEQTLNRWLQLEWPPTPALHHLVDAAHHVFGDWVHALEAGEPHAPDVSALMAEAERLRSSETAVIEPAAITIAPAAAPEPGEAIAEAEAPLATEAEPLEFAALELGEGGEILPFAGPAVEIVPPLEEGAVEEVLPEAVPEEIEFEAAALDESVLEEPAFEETSLDDNWLNETSLEEIGLEEAASEAPEEIVLEEAFSLEDLAPLAPEATEPAAEPPAVATEAVQEPLGEAPEWLEDTDLSGPPPAASLYDAATIEALDEPELDLEPEEISLEAPVFSDLIETPSEEPLLEPETGEPVIDLAFEVPEEALLEEPMPEEVAAPEVLPEEVLPEEVLPEEVLPEEALAEEALIEEALIEEPLVEEIAAADFLPEELVTEETALEEAQPEEELLEEPLVEELGETVTAPEVEEAEAAPIEEAAPFLVERDVVRVGDNEISRPLFDLYLGEARHHLSVLHSELARIEANPTLVPGEPPLRAAHTLAGISGTTRVMSVQVLARALEHALERLRDTAHAPTPEQAAVLKTSNETLEAMLAQVAARLMPLDMPELVEQLDGIGRTIPLEAEPAVIPAAAPATAPSAAAAAEAPAEAPAAKPAVRDDLDEQLLPIFLEEGNELVAELHATLRNWSSGAPGDHAKASARLLHTLKGSARMAGAMTLGEHVHQLESRLEAALAAGREPEALIDELVTGLDQAEQMITTLGSGGAAPAAEEAAAATTATATAVEVEPAEAEAEASGALATLRVRADTVDRFVNEAGEIGIARTRIAGELRTLRRSLLDLTENVIRLRNQLREVEIQADMQMQSRIAHTGSAESDFDPLEMDRYTRLQELTRMMAESVGDVTTVQQSLLRNLDGADIALNSQARLSRDLQQALMQVRMVPFDSLADRLYRVTRQTAKDLGKRANLDLRGGRIEIDRSVLEHITAPLEHLLRNAVAHGIESPEQRQAAGKRDIGQITLAVSQEGNEIAISLSDDGNGLDYDKIAERARASGLLAPNEVADERRLTNLIFLPGFSTAGNVSTVSGRGVGMDVVKSETAAVGGRIDIRAARGKGTEFRIYLPLTLAVTQALLVVAGGRTYAIPSSMIAQVMELKADALESLRAAGGTEWQGEAFNYRYLPRLLGDHASQPVEQRFNWVLLLRAGAQTLALHVDTLRGNQEIVVKNAGPQLARVVGISGATVLGDGEIVLILNPVALASRGLAERTPTQEAPAGELEALEPLEPVAPAPVQHQPTIMVVDDSLTVRKITGRLLEREGYRVVTAKDGVDALEHLLETVPDVILSDIEMPRMDGFDLLRNIRADDRLTAVPVIMITSRLADKHRQLAEKIGANEYLGKPYEESELLGLLRSYTERRAAPRD